MNWIKKIVFYSIMLLPAFTIAYLGVIVFLSYTWYSDDKFWRAYVPKNTIEHIINEIGEKALIKSYLTTRNTWQAQENCVQLDDKLIYKPSNSLNCTFENIEFNVKIDHLNEKRIHETPNIQAKITSNVLIIGDSHAMGWGVENNETFPAILDSHFKHINFDNMSVSSYGTPRELLLAKSVLNIKKYDLIIIQYCDNDLSEINHYFKNKNLKKEFKIKNKIGLPINQIRKNFITKYAENIMDIAKNPFFYTDIPFENIDNIDYKSHTGMLADTLENIVDTDIFPEIIIFTINGSGKETENATRYLKSEVKQLDQDFQSRIKIIDPMSKARNKSKLFYKLDDHLNSNGHLFIATQLKDDIRAKLEK